jgi:hypothetical protein
MNANSQRSLNAGWTRHTSGPRAPQVRPVTLTTFAGEAFTGVAWVRGDQMDRATLHATVQTARQAYQDTGDTHVFTDSVVLHNADGFVAAVAFSDIQRISEVA